MCVFREALQHLAVPCDHITSLFSYVQNTTVQDLHFSLHLVAVGSGSDIFVVAGKCQTQINTVAPASAHTLATVSTCVCLATTLSQFMFQHVKGKVQCLYVFIKKSFFCLISISPPPLHFFFFWLACEQRRFHHSCGNRWNNTPGNASIIRNIHVVMHCAHASLSFCHFGCVTALLLSAIC